MAKKKISGAAICLEKLDTCKDDQVVTIPWLREGFTSIVTEAAAYNVIWRMRGVGALEPVPGTDALESVLNRPKLEKFLDKHTPASPYFYARNNTGRGGLKKNKRANKAPKPRTQASAVPDDINVIDNLLNAMAEAEPILNKLKNIYEAVHS